MMPDDRSCLDRPGPMQFSPTPWTLLPETQLGMSSRALAEDCRGILTFMKDDDVVSRPHTGMWCIAIARASPLCKSARSQKKARPPLAWTLQTRQSDEF